MKSMEYFHSTNSVLFEGDVLENINKLENEKVYLMGNLPYYITSEIITSCLKSIPNLTGAIFMVQKEFADRICNEISSLSIFVSAFGKFSYLKKISPSCFYPKPEASSALIRFTPNQKRYSKTQIEKFELLLDPTQADKHDPQILKAVEVLLGKLAEKSGKKDKVG